MLNFGQLTSKWKNTNTNLSLGVYRCQKYRSLHWRLRRKFFYTLPKNATKPSRLTYLHLPAAKFEARDFLAKIWELFLGETAVQMPFLAEKLPVSYSVNARCACTSWPDYAVYTYCGHPSIICGYVVSNSPALMFVFITVCVTCVLCVY